MDTIAFNQFKSLVASDFKAKFEKWWLLDDMKTGKNVPDNIELTFSIESQIMRVKFFIINKDDLGGSGTFNNLNISIKDGIYEQLNDGEIIDIFNTIMDTIVEIISNVKPYKSATCGELYGEDLIKYMNGSIDF
jgi:hypothetical protein